MLKKSSSILDEVTSKRLYVLKHGQIKITKLSPSLVKQKASL